MGVTSSWSPCRRGTQMQILEELEDLARRHRLFERISRNPLELSLLASDLLNERPEDSEAPDLFRGGGPLQTQSRLSSWTAELAHL